MWDIRSRLYNYRFQNKRWLHQVSARQFWRYACVTQSSSNQAGLSITPAQSNTLFSTLEPRKRAAFGNIQSTPTIRPMMSFSIFSTSLTSSAIIITKPRGEFLLQQLWKFPSSTQRHKTSASVGIFSYAFELSDSAHVQRRRYVFETVREEWAKRNVYKRGHRALGTQTTATATADRGPPPFLTQLSFCLGRRGWSPLLQLSIPRSSEGE